MHFGLAVAVLVVCGGTVCPFMGGLGPSAFPWPWREASSFFLAALARRVVRREKSILRRRDLGKTGLDEVGVSLF